MIETQGGTDHNAGWYVRQDARIRGPFSSAKIRHEVLQGGLRLSDGVSRDGFGWTRIAEVPEVVPLQLRRGGACDVQEWREQTRTDRRHALVTLSVLLLLAVAAVVGTLSLERAHGPPPPPDCATPPAPGVNWSNCRLDGRMMPSAALEGANLSNASLVNAGLDRAKLHNANLAYANLAGSQLSNAVLRGARLLGANLRGARLSHADLSGAELAHADLTAARVDGANWAGASLAGAIWLDGRRCAPMSVGTCR